MVPDGQPLPSADPNTRRQLIQRDAPAQRRIHPTQQSAAPARRAFVPRAFKATLVDRDANLPELARYIVLNPVRAGMVNKPNDWAWSSYRASMGLEPAPLG